MNGDVINTLGRRSLSDRSLLYSNRRESKFWKGLKWTDARFGYTLLLCNGNR